jgi:hypothetical protein
MSSSNSPRFCPDWLCSVGCVIGMLPLLGCVIAWICGRSGGGLSAATASTGVLFAFCLTTMVTGKPPLSQHCCVACVEAVRRLIHS